MKFCISPVPMDTIKEESYHINYCIYLTIEILAEDWKCKVDLNSTHN